MCVSFKSKCDVAAGDAARVTQLKSKRVASAAGAKVLPSVTAVTTRKGRREKLRITCGNVLCDSRASPNPFSSLDSRVDVRVNVVDDVRPSNGLVVCTL
jgi:hypothetical protein